MDWEAIEQQMKCGSLWNKGRGISKIYLPQKENDKFTNQKNSKDHVANKITKTTRTPPSAI